MTILNELIILLNRSGLGPKWIIFRVFSCYIPDELKHKPDDVDGTVGDNTTADFFFDILV